MEESEWGFKNQTNHGNKVINWALSKEGEKQQEALGKDVTELVETSVWRYSWLLFIDVMTGEN